MGASTAWVEVEAGVRELVEELSRSYDSIGWGLTRPLPGSDPGGLYVNATGQGHSAIGDAVTRGRHLLTRIKQEAPPAADLAQVLAEIEDMGHQRIELRRSPDTGIWWCETQASEGWSETSGESWGAWTDRVERGYAMGATALEAAVARRDQIRGLRAEGSEPAERERIVNGEREPEEVLTLPDLSDHDQQADAGVIEREQRRRVDAASEGAEEIG